jgi:hypothetical protein
MRHQPKAVAAVLGSLIVAAGCSSVSVTTDWDREVAFADYRSFAFLERPERSDRLRRQASPLVERRIDRELTVQIAAKGYEQVPAYRADLLVTYYTDVRQQVVVSHSGWGYRGWRHGTSFRRTYPVGTLVVDLIDRSSRQLVWRGVASGSFGTKAPSDEKIRKVVTKLLHRFPPPPHK